MTDSIETSRPREAQPGRPRDPEVDRAILQATLQALRDRGYAGMSVEGCASEAGVGKTSIYRRYRSKEELTVAAVKQVGDDSGPSPDTGDSLTDIVEMLLQHKAVQEHGPGYSLIGALLVEERHNPEFLQMFRERAILPHRQYAITILQRGVDRGDIRADVDLGVAIEAMIGAMLARHIMGIPESRERIEETVSTLWSGLATNPQGRDTRR